jgi:hypothetical protein
MNQYDELRSRIAQGWTAMLFCFICIFISDLVKSAITNDFSKWANDPGPVGLKVVCIAFTVYILTPMMVRNVRARAYRWVATGQAALLGFFILAHQLAHALSNSRPFDITHIFDFAHHGLAVWVVILSARWAAQDDVQAVPMTARMAGSH